MTLGSAVLAALACTACGRSRAADNPPPAKAPRDAAAVVDAAPPASDALAAQSRAADMIDIPAGETIVDCVQVPGVVSKKECPFPAIVDVEINEFYIDRTEVTVAAYRECVAAGKCTVPVLSANWQCTPQTSNWLAKGREDHPINCVEAKQAVAYCSFRGDRVPSDYEWQRAARGPDGNPFPWGSDKPSCKTAIVARDDQSRSGCGKGHTWPVGSKPDGASPYGVLDMVGNVEEIVMGSSGVIADRTYAINVPDQMTTKGGGYVEPAGSRTLRAWEGGVAEPAPWVGFRCVLPVVTLKSERER